MYFWTRVNRVAWKIQNILDGIIWVARNSEECFFVRRYNKKYTPSWQEIHRQISMIRRLQARRKIYAQKIVIGVSTIEVQFVGFWPLKKTKVKK